MAVDPVEFLVRFLHIMAGTFWLGAILYTHVVMAGLRKTPPNVMGPALIAVAKRGLPSAIGAGVGTVVFGLWNQYNIYHGFDFSSQPQNVGLGVGLVCAILMLGLGIFVQRPTVRALEELAPMGPSEKLDATRGRLAMALYAVTLLGVIALFAMVFAVVARAG
jgi:hypothetical protein